MRNAFVVLVALYFGRAAGFIVSTGKPETSKSGNTLAENIVAKTNSKPNSIEFIQDTSRGTEKVEIIQNKLGDINEKVLYEDVQQKENVVNERSFLFLNQKFKKLPRPSQQIAGVSCDIFDQSLKEETGEQLGAFPFKFPSNYNDDVYKQYQTANGNKMGKITSSYFAPPNPCNSEEKGDKNVQRTGLSTEQREYLELLKEPILRTDNNQNVHKDKQALAYKSRPEMNNAKKQYVIVPNPTLDNRQGGIGKNYGLNRPYLLHRPVFNKDLDNLDSNYINDEDLQRVLSSNIEDKLLDRYLKAGLTEQVHKEGLKEKHADCNYHDCVLKTTRPAPQKKVDSEADCKCGQWLHLKSDLKDRIQRKDSKKYASFTTTGPVSVELGSLEDSLYLTKLDGDITKTMRNYKNILHE